MTDKEKLVEQLKSAYRKFKTYTYYDNYGAINRAKLATFENKNKLSSNDDFFNELATKLLNNDWDELCKSLDDISVLCYPKSIKSDTSLGNIPDDDGKIEKLNYFIDLDITSHILGTLWILRSGWVLDHRLHKNCHGNRINKEVLSRIISCEEKGLKYSEPTPFLFEPYFKRYQLWRDEGLDSVERLLDKKENAIMLTLDFKEYYYTSTIDFKKLKDDIEKAKLKLFDNSNKSEDEFDDKLNQFIEKIFEKYTEKFKRLNYAEKLPMIPIGFLPSLIIANWNLQAFDQAILDLVNPVYYGRYVDDVLIVFKSHPESESFSNEKFDISAEEILEKYLTCYAPDPDHRILRIIHDKEGTSHPKSESVQNENLSDEEIFQKKESKISDEKNKIKEYGLNNLCEKECRFKKDDKVNNLNNPSNYDNLRIQSKKLKVFRFSHDNSRALIENFKKEIYKNSSEFRLMHEVGKLYSDIGKNIFSIQYAESINKISGIESIKVNKFELSKTLSWLIGSYIYEKDIVSQKDINNIIHAFSGSKKIEFMILWEKLIEFLFIQKKYKILEEEIEKILIKISKLTFKRNNQLTYEPTYIFKGTEKDSEDLLKKSLIKFLYCTYTRVLSLRKVVDDPYLIKIDELFSEYLTQNKCRKYIDNMPKQFVLSYLYKNSLMKDPLLLIKCSIFKLDFSNDTYDLIDSNFPILNEENGDHKVYPFYPRYIQFHETTLHIIDNLLRTSENENLNVIKYLNESRGLYDDINGFKKGTSEKNKSFYEIECEAKSVCKCKFSKTDRTNSNLNVDIIRTGTEKKAKIKVGLINTCLNKKCFENALKGNPNRTAKRLDKIASIINDAITKKVELLVMPEMYIPYEWVPIILDISRKHGMAMVFGIEPIIFGKTVGNYIAITLPSETENHQKNCTLIMRLKNSYSPEELREYRKYILDPKKNLRNNNPYTNYVLCVWNDVYFAPYYCYEIANIDDRSLFKSCCDMVIVSEYNKDTTYFTAIAESLSRDLFCYCIKVNSSEFGGTCILQPSKSENRYLINLRGGDEGYVVSHTLNIDKLRNHQILAYESEITGTELKPKPPRFGTHRVRGRMNLPQRGTEDH